MKVYVNDSSGWGDRARVFIYLLREDQRVRFILRQSPDEVCLCFVLFVFSQNRLIGYAIIHVTVCLKCVEVGVLNKTNF